MPASVKEQIRILKEGVVDLISEKELEERLQESVKNKKPLRVKYGADPSAPDLHLGHTVPLRKLKTFQELGHTIVFIIGDFTAAIGDPTERTETRRTLSAEEVARNAKTYQDQVFKILDRSKTEVRYNSEWLDRMNPREFLNLTSQYTVARLIERDDFKKRFEANRPISLTEFLYPLLQGYDSVKVNSDVELGGTDQKFNLLVGRELQKTWNQKPQMVMTMPLIEGTDGAQKMSKSLGNHIALFDSPKDIFGKIMSIPDALMEKYILYVSGLDPESAKKIISEIKNGSIHPRKAKADLAEQVVSLYHSASDGKKAREEFDLVFKSKGVPEDVPVIRLNSKKMDIVSLLKDSNLVTSKAEGRRLIEQGGVRLNQTKVDNPQLEVEISKPVLVQCGKRKFAKVEYAGT